MDQDDDPADPTPRDRALAGELSFEAARAVFRPSGHWNRWEQREGVASGDLQRAGWGTVAESALLECYRQNWQRRWISAAGRIVHVGDRLADGCGIVGRGAALAIGLAQMPTPMDVTTWGAVKRPTRTRRLGVLRWQDGYAVPEGAHRWTSAAMPDGVWCDVDGIVVLRALENAAWCAAREDPVVAHQICCQIIRTLCAFDRDDPEGSRVRESEVKAQIHAVLDAHHGWARRPVEARWIIDNADAGCESVGEAVNAFILRAVGISGTVTQKRIETKGTVRYADLYIDGVLIEHEGRAKDGEVESEWWDARTKRDGRDKELSHLKLAVVHVTAPDQKDPDQLVADVFAASPRPIAIDPSKGWPGVLRWRRAGWMKR